MLDCSLIKYFLKLLNKHIRWELFTMIYKIFVKYTLLFISGAHFFVYIIDVLGAPHNHAPNFWSPDSYLFCFYV